MKPKLKTKTVLRFADLPKDYPALCGLLMPRPIHDAVDYANVAEVTDAMVLWQDDCTPDQIDYFDLLCSLLEDHDRAQEHRLPRASATEVLKHLLEEQGQTAADLSRILGATRNLGAMILRGERNLTLAHVRKLVAHFKVGPDAFI